MDARGHRVAVVWALALAAAALAVAAAGCFQELDSRASSESAQVPTTPPSNHTIDLMTPPIGITTGDDGETTDDACEATTFAATEILRNDCASCHGGGPGQNLGQPAFDFVLDVPRLLAARSSTVKEPVTMQPVRFLVPGDPDHSRVYVRMFRREMPPGDIVGLPSNPKRPTISDVSVVRHWIAQCIGPKEGDDGAGKGGDAGAPDEDDAGAPPASDGGSVTSPGDAGADAASTDASAATDAGARTDATDARRSGGVRPAGGG